MPSTYPGQLDIFPGAPYVDGTEFLFAAYANYWISAILAIETTIGVGTGATAQNPLYSQTYGTTYPTVTARIAAIEAVVDDTPGLNTAAGNIHPVSTAAAAGTVGAGADAGHVHVGVRSFTGSTGLAVSSSDGNGHGDILASVNLPFVFGSNGFTVPNFAENTGFLVHTTPTVGAGAWVFFFSGYVNIGFGTGTFYTTSVGSILFSTVAIVGNGDNSSSSDQYATVNAVCAVFFTAAGSVSLWSQASTETGYSGAIYSFAFQLSLTS